MMLWLHHSLIHCGDAEVPPEGFGVGPRTLVHLLQDREYESLQKLGGVRPFFLPQSNFTFFPNGVIFS
jgi:hypothetical protein